MSNNPLVASLLLDLYEPVRAAAIALFDRLPSQWVMYIVWLGLFGATFLLIRMLVTRWGDTDVTRKAIVLSLLVHAMAGLGSSTVHIAKETLSTSLPSVKIRGKFADDVETANTAPVKSNALFEDRTPSEHSRTTIERVSRDPLAEDAVPVPDKSRPFDMSLPALPDLASKTDQPESLPPAARPAPPNISRDALAAAIPVDTRSSPSAVSPRTNSPAGPERRVVEPTTPGVDTPDVPRPTRTGRPDDVRAEFTPKSDTTPNLLPDEPRAEIKRGPTVNPLTTLNETTGSRSTPEGAGSPNESPTRTVGRTPGTDPVRRTDLGTGGAELSPTVERNRPASGNNTPATTPGSGLARNGVPDGLPSEFEPNVIRRDLTVDPRRNGEHLPATYRLRNLAKRTKNGLERGASLESEKAVEAALAWLAHHQSPEGNWDPDGFHLHCPAGDRCKGLATLGVDPDPLDIPNKLERQKSGMEADSGVTGLVLLAFFGAGYSQDEGIYADNIDRGLRYLMRIQDSEGFLGGKAGRYARMYCHGMATIALAEAYGITHDKRLHDPVQRAIRYIIRSQNSGDGGWRYVAGQPAGDMSMFGWQLMALKSAATAGIDVPRETTARCVEFLRINGKGKFGGLAAYRREDPAKASMTAEALFCRQLLGLKRTNPAAEEGAKFLMQNLPSRTNYDLYYWYYGQLAMYQYGGDEWGVWNGRIRDLLVRDQRTDAHAQGSWDPHTPWGDFGGRVFSTAMSTLILEAYYRFLEIPD